MPFPASEESRGKNANSAQVNFPFPFFFFVLLNIYFLPSSLSTSMYIIYTGPPRVIKPAIPLPEK